MKKITGIFLVAVLCLTAGFAQQSMASISTTGQFGNDVDMFMDVNAWQQVNPEKFFLYGGYGAYGSGDIRLGFAKKFSPLYFGAYLKGGFPTLTFTSSASQKERTIANKLDGSLIFGFGNIGIKASMHYEPTTHSYTYTPATNQKDWTSDYYLITNLNFGINLGESQLYAVTAGIGLTANVNKPKQKQNNALTAWSNNSDYILNLHGGVETDYANNGGMTQTWGVAARIDTQFYPRKTGYQSGTYNTQAGQFMVGFTVTPKWAFKYETEDRKFAMKLTTTADAVIKHKADKDYTVTSGTKAYAAPRNKTPTFSVTPAFNLGIVVAPIPDTINLNAGIGFETPKLNIEGKTTQTRNTADGTVTNTAKETTTTLEGAFTGNAAIGFTWFITKNVMFDASWEILNNFSFNINNALSTNIAFLLSVKI